MKATSCTALVCITLLALLASSEGQVVLAQKHHRLPGISDSTPTDPTKTCRPLSKQLIQSAAKHNTVMITAMDHLVAKIFGPTWINNVIDANITYWFIAALDPQTSILLANLGVVNCFNAPVDRLTYHGKGRLRTNAVRPCARLCHIPGQPLNTEH